MQSLVRKAGHSSMAGKKVLCEIRDRLLRQAMITMKVEAVSGSVHSNWTLPMATNSMSALKLQMSLLILL